MATTIQRLAIKSIAEIRDDYLRTYANGLRRRGIPNPDVSEGTEIYTRATALAQQIYVASSNVPIAADAQMPDAAQGEDLERIARPYKLSLRPAGPSSGPLVLSATVSSSVAIPQGAQLVDPAGLTYEVAIGGAYADGAEIPIRAVATGAATNLAEGTVLRWVAPPPFVNTTAAIGAGGLTGGVDAETHEGLRARLLERLQLPRNGFNWATVVAAAEEASSAVQKAFAYSAANGPSTVHVAVTRAVTATNRNRDVDELVVFNTINPYVLGQMPEFVDVAVTTVVNWPVDVTIGLALPASTKAAPAGPGGGWTDGTPFPIPETDSGFHYCNVTAVTSSTVFTVKSDVAPTDGVSQVCWVSTDDWKLRRAKVQHSTPAGTRAWQLVVDTPFVSDNGVAIAVGDFVFPNAERMDVYVAALLDAFARMGPGEKTNSPGLLPRAYRRPLPSTSWPSELTAAFLRPLTLAGEEVGAAQYIYRSDTTPPLPISINGPNIFVPSRIAFYPL